jgi:FAD/FMN-containing dehydrogenase/Fe-S oxidoreductase
VPEAEVVRDLRSRGVSEVDTAPRRLAEYSSDASLYRVLPAAVAFPRAAEEIAVILRTCRDHEVPLTMRGAGTSIAGNAVGSGVVLDLSRYLTRIIAVDPDARTATVEPGVVLDDLQRAASRHGLRFGPDPSTHSRCTIGGMIGNNACGSRALGYGRTADNVLALTALTGGGEWLDTTATAGLRSAPDTAAPGAADTAAPVLAGLRRVATEYLSVLRTELGRFPRQVSGYSLEHLLPERGFDVAKTLVGTEGTCAITTTATLRLVPAPACTALVVLGYDTLADAADAAPALLPLRPTAIEGLDARIIDLVRAAPGAPGRPGRARLPDLPTGGGLVLVEVGGASEADAASAARQVVAVAGAGASLIAADRGQAAAIWRVREDGAGLVARPAGGRAHHAGWEDAAVPPQRLGSYLRGFDALLAEHGLHGLPYGHFGDGCVHVRLDFRFDEPGGAQAFRRFLLDAADLVAAHGGSMSGEHGDGRARSELLPRMYSAQALAAFGAVKAVLDPGNVLNPGVIVAPRPVDADLRPARPHTSRAGLAFRYEDDEGDFGSAVSRCTGVGKCRADLTGGGGVMCPSFLATRDEKDSTRARARVLQEMVTGGFPAGWRAPEVAQSLDLCLACRACSADCPTSTDMATYKAEVLHQRYRGRLRPPAHYALGWLPRWAALASRAPRLANALLGAPGLAPLGARLAGLDPRRAHAMPRLAQQTFRDWFAGRRGPAPPAPGRDKPVVLWADTFTNYFSPQVGIAAVVVLEAAGYTVSLSRAGDCCGLTWISTGQLGTARKVMTRALAGLAPYAAAGTPVVGLEPSCVAAFRGDAAGLADASVAAAGESVRTLAELLTATPGWQPPAHLHGLRGVAQPHCHHHAVLGWDTDAALLAGAGAAVHRVGGCCGLAGNFGMERGHYDVSVAVAGTALLPALAGVPDGNGVALADGFSCRTQILQLAGRRAYHLAELLAEPRC